MNASVEHKLTEKNTQPTSMRILIYDYLSSQNAALSVTDIEEHFGQADKTTIYRTLKTFEENGIVHGIQENNTTKYILCGDQCNEHTHKDWHLHLYCKICKKTTCRKDIVLPQHIQTDFRIDEVRFFAKGICEDCLAEMEQA